MKGSEQITYLGTQPNNELGDGLADVINSNYATVNIIRRFPSSGMPAQGVPFSIKIEVQTYRSGGDFWRTPFACLDAFVVARGLYQYKNAILGSTFIRTDSLRGCRGEGTISFVPEFRPGEKDWVQFELYPGGTQEWFRDKTTLQRVKNGDVEMLAKSEPMRFNASQKKLANSGIITKEESVWDNLPANNPIVSSLGSITTLLAVAGGAYLVFKNGDAIKEMIEEFAEEVTDEGIDQAVSNRVQKGKQKLSTGLSKAQQKLG